MSLQDPFFVVKEEVQQEVSSMRGLFARWKELLEAGVTSSSEEFEWTTQELKSSLKSIEYDLQDLEETISIVENNRAKFKLEDEEIDRRKGFINDMKKAMQEVRDTMDDPRTRGKLEQDKRNALLTGDKSQKLVKDKYSKLDDAIHEDNEDFLSKEGQRQQMIVKQQDENLDVLHDGVQRLGQIGLTINDELEDQGRMLDDFDRDMDRTEGNLKRAQRGVRKLLKHKDRKSICCIVLLIIVLIVLVSLLFS